MSELTIKVIIADRPYRLKINSDEEENIRKAASLINERIKEYSEQYAFNDRQDLLSMVVLHFAASAKNLKEESDRNEEIIVKKLLEIDNKLS